jgi:cathepsin L
MGINRDISFFNYKKSNFQISQDFLQNLPKNVDWRERGITTPVKDQGSCGSCWAFATSAVLESHISLQNEGKSVIVSPQELVDCVNNDQKCGGTGGCNGATQELGFKYIEQNGISSLSNYPYFAKEGKCNSENVKKSAKIGSFVKLPENDYNALMQSVATIGPIAISVAASEWSFYDSGVFNGFCGTEVNHVVALEGYGTDENGNDYWLVRNSWSENWGENGYIRIYREKSAKDVTCDIDSNPNAGNGCEGGPSEISVCGLCGILSDAAYPVNARLIDN